MSTPFLNLTPANPPAFPFAIPVPRAYQAWTLFANLAGVGGLQVLQVKELQKQVEPVQLPIYLCEMITRCTFEAALVMHFDRIDPLTDIWMRARVKEYFGQGLYDDAIALILSKKLDEKPIALMPSDEATRPGAEQMWQPAGIPETRRVQGGRHG